MRIAVVRMAVERRVVGDVNEVTRSSGTDGRSALRLESLSDVSLALSLRVEVASLALSRTFEVMSGAKGSEEDLVEDQKLYHGMVIGSAVCARRRWCGGGQGQRNVLLKAVRVACNVDRDGVL